MYFKEYGSSQNETIILLHGGGLSWWNYRREAELLSEDYHVILPVLDGHAKSDHPFTTIEENAEEIISYIENNYDGSVFMIGGLSLGGQILLEILSKRKNICKYALVESAAVVPSRLTTALIGFAFESSYPLIKNRKFARLQFHSLHMNEDLFEEYYKDTCQIKKSDMIAFMKESTSYTLKKSFSDAESKIFVIAGKRENQVIKKSAEIIYHANHNCIKNIINGYYHGEFSINHAEEYVTYIRKNIIDRFYTVT